MRRYLVDVRPIILSIKLRLGGSLGRGSTKMLWNLSSLIASPLDKAIRQSGHAMVNMGIDAVISNPYHHK